MTWPVNFSGLAGGNEPLSLFDAMFAQVAAMAPIPCTATGTNSITLNPIGNAPSATNLGAYGSLNLFSFIATATSTGVVSAQFGALASLPVFKNDGTTAVTTGDIAIGRPYMLMFSQALNSGGGGFYLLRPAVQPSGGQPTTTVLTSGTGATYTTPANCLQLYIRMVGGGGGGSGSASAGGNGTATVFNAIAANPGGGASASTPASSIPGTGGGGGTGGAGAALLRIQGGNGGSGTAISGGITGSFALIGPIGGSSPFGGAGNGGSTSGTVNSGSGGGGQNQSIPSNNPGATGGGGGAGEYVELIINNPAATYTYTVGASGSAGTGAGSGGSGIIIVQERYQD